MRHVEFIVEATRYLDSYYFGEKLRKDIEFNEINKEFIENVEDWAEEYDSSESMFDFLDNEFEFMEWLKPDFRDRKVIKAIMKDAGYKWSNRYDQILDGKKSGAYILLYHPLEAYKNVYDSLLWGVNNEEDFLQNKVNLLRTFEVEGLNELKEKFESGERFHVCYCDDNICGGTYRGEPYVLYLVCVFK